MTLKKTVKQKKSVIKCIPLQLEFSVYKMYCPSDLFYLLFIGFNKNADAMLLIEKKKEPKNKRKTIKTIWYFKMTRNIFLRILYN